VGRKQVIVQLEDRLVEELDRAAQEVGLSRSELLRRAARLYLGVLEEEALDRSHAEGYRRFPPTEEDAAWVEASWRMAGRIWTERQTRGE
jgi:hypothetical protein